jgi:hypothetical protein
MTGQPRTARRETGRRRAPTAASRFTLAWPFVALLLLLTPALLRAQADGSVRGQVRSDADGAPLVGATIEVLHADWRGGAVSGATGLYAVLGVPPGRSTVRVRHLGHEALDLEVVIPAGREVVLDLLLPVQPVALAPVRVEADAPLPAIDSAAAPAADLALVGSRALGSTPGIAELGLSEAVRGVPTSEPVDPGSVLYVRGAAADLKLVYLDGAPVYAPFPLGGILEPFAPDLLTQAEIYLGGAPARYDGGLSYVMDLRTRPGRSGLHTEGSLDLLSGRLLAEGGWQDRVSLLAGVRGMHPLVSGPLLNGSMPYSYQEGFARGDVRIGSSTSVSVTGFSNAEAVRISDTASPDSLISWGNDAGSIRLFGRFGRTAAEIGASIGHYSARLPLTGARPVIADGSATRMRVSADLGRALGALQLRYGASLDQQEYRASATDAGNDGLWTVAESAGRVAGLYGEVVGSPGERVRVRGGLRVDRFSTGDLAFAPRLAAVWMVSDRAALTLAAGRYHQFLRPPGEALLESADPISFAPPSGLAVGRAAHLTVGLDQDLGEGVRLGVDAFFKDFGDVPGSVPNAANASGVDLWVRRPTGQWTGWLGYSLAWVWSSSPTPGQSDFMGRHLLSAGLGAPVGARTRVDLGFAYGAGLPYAAIPLATADRPPPSVRSGGASRELAGADRGGTETAPLLHQPDQPYLRLDASVSQRWTPRRGATLMEISPYLRIINSLGQRDALFYLHDRSRDDRPRAIGTLPLIPVAGLEWRF